MHHLAHRTYIPLKSGFGFTKGEKLKLIEISGTEIIFQKINGCLLSFDAKNSALIEIGEHSLHIYEPLCRETTLKETWLIRKSNKLCASQIANPSYGKSEIFWNVREFLVKNNASYLLGEFSDSPLKYKDGMIYDYGEKGNLKLTFCYYNSEDDSNTINPFRLVSEIIYTSAKRAIYFLDTLIP